MKDKIINTGDLVTFDWDLKHQPIGVVVDKCSQAGEAQGSITIRWIVGNQKGKIKCYHPNTHEMLIKLADKDGKGVK